jgi:hypothetical protein
VRAGLPHAWSVRADGVRSAASTRHLIRRGTERGGRRERHEIACRLPAGRQGRHDCSPRDASRWWGITTGCVRNILLRLFSG